MESPFISVAGAAARLGMHQSTLYRAIQDGKAPVDPVQLGKRTVFRVSDLERFIVGETRASA